MASSLPATKILMVVVLDDAKDGGADKEADPLDESEGKDCGQDFKSYVVNEIIDDVVEQTFFFPSGIETQAVSGAARRGS